ncbi:MAG: hypothetical protein H8D47_01780 [Planctomycetes bacterium]|nr:hypothetical protein [Planctomycetota bacterium]MBL7106571.1 hypothetical protein [Phycisphaerae bacterium]
MSFDSKRKPVELIFIAVISWIIPGAGYWYIREKFRSTLIFFAISATFLIGLYLGSIAVIDPVGGKLWYIAQIMTSPLVAIIGRMTAAGGYFAYGRPNEIGQLYTSIAGLMNLFAVINCVYLAYSGTTEMEEPK